MRSKLRAMTVTGGIGAVVVLILLVLAAGNGSWALAITGGLLGTLLIIVGAIVLLKFVDRFTKAMDRSSTRARNHEARTDALARQNEGLESRLSPETDCVGGKSQR